MLPLRLLIWAPVMKRIYTEEQRLRRVEQTRQWRLANPDKQKQSCKHWYEANIAFARERSRKWGTDNKEKTKVRNAEWQKANPERAKELHLLWAKANPHKVTAGAARRRARKAQATPVWASSDAINDVYRLAQDLTELSGIDYHVDHIVPLKSKLVCGLHTHHNLEVIPGTENLSKSNRFWPDMP